MAAPLYLPISVSALNHNLCYLCRNLHSLHFLANSTEKRIEQLLKGNTVIHTFSVSGKKEQQWRHQVKFYSLNINPRATMEENEKSEQRQFCSTAVFHGDGTTAKLQLQRTSTWSTQECRTSTTKIPAKKVIRPSRSITMSKQNVHLEVVKGTNNSEVPPSNLTGHRCPILIYVLNNSPFAVPCEWHTFFIHRNYTDFSGLNNCSWVNNRNFPVSPKQHIEDNVRYLQNMNSSQNIARYYYYCGIVHFHPFGLYFKVL